MRLVPLATLAALPFLMLGACASQEKDESVAPIGMANPASVHCGQAGGRSDSAPEPTAANMAYACSMTVANAKNGRYCGTTAVLLRPSVDLDRAVQ